MSRIYETRAGGQVIGEYIPPPVKIDETQAIIKERYALGLLAEEMGEVLQLIGKSLRFGLDSPLGNSTPRQRLPTELGDVMAAINYACTRGLVDEKQVLSARERKFYKLTDPEATDNLGRRLAP